MPKGLIIVESPAKASTISKFLKNKYTVKASFGHVRDLPKTTMGVNIEKNFQPMYVLDKTKSKILSELREAVKDADTVYLASDHDREGEAIAWHLSQAFDKELKGKQIYRIVFNEITSKAINESITNPGSIDQAKVDAQQARRVLDRIVGYSVSPLLWKVIAKDLSAGRVQSVALRLVCERENEISSFIPKEYWKIEADFWRDKLAPFHAVLEKWDGGKIEIPNEARTLELVGDLSSKEAILSEIKRTGRSVEPLPPFITSTLQQEASKLLNMQATKTMSVAQQLYEGIDLKGERTGLITYMRTDSVRIADEAVVETRKLIKDRFGEKGLNPSVRVYKNKSTAQDAHEAIRPTDPFRTPESIQDTLTRDQLRLYTLIWQRFIATQMKPVKLAVTNAQISVGRAIFAASGSQITEQGFLEAYPHVNIILGEKIDPAYTKEDKLEYSEPVYSQNFTSPPSRYTEASLIKELEAKGIGRPSTYASIISTIKTRKYVLMEKKSIAPTSLGMDVNTFLVGKFEKIFNVKFTAEMEDQLDEVEYSKLVWHDVVRSYYDQLMALIGEVDVKKEKTSFTVESGLICDVCKEGKMLIKRARGGEFLACSRYPECKNSKSFKRDEQGNIVIFEPVVLEEKCPTCGSALMKRNGRFGEFTACSAYPKCKYIKPNTLGIKCPECGKGEIIQRKNKQGRIFYSCTTYPECKWITNDKPVKITCPHCGSDHAFEKHDKELGVYLLCPKCKAKLG
ncbi:MAG TPA: type I DNA topoisomerase [Candidatus Cloacimonadota bacterium]|nr:type I DNA topoisomerase [Candidatus Cloacimonadota bacterium]HPS38965.1 type I DNA topoisomerase [Candidatus Cloacimonadota bacterium]